MLESDGRTSMTISTHDLPAAHDGQFYYAWLLDPTTNKMLPLGQVGPSGTASFEVSDRLLAAYSAIDVSLEETTETPSTHQPRCSGRPTPDVRALRNNTHHTPKEHHHEVPIDPRLGHRRRRADRKPRRHGHSPGPGGPRA